MEVSSERVFLHDLATPLAAAIFVIDSLIDDRTNNPLSPDLEQLRMVLAALTSLGSLIEKRRSFLKGGPINESK